MKAIVLICLFLLSGCGSVWRKEVEVVDTKVHVIRVSQAYLTPCLATPFMERASFLTLSAPEREVALANHVVALYEDVSACDKKITKIREENSVNLRHETQ